MQAFTILQVLIYVPIEMGRLTEAINYSSSPQTNAHLIRRVLESSSALM
jgi:hypothetical protein